MNMVGKWELADMNEAVLPPQIDAAFKELTGSLTGAKYISVLYCGKQNVHGTHYLLICKQIISSRDPSEYLMIINCCEMGNCFVAMDRIDTLER